MGCEMASVQTEPDMPQLPGLLGWVLAACVAIGILLTTAIRWMYGKIESMYATQLTDLKQQCNQQQKQIDDCVTDREELRVMCAGNKEKILHLEQSLQEMKRGLGE